MAILKLADKAESDLEEIWLFIAMNNEIAADQHLDTLYQKFLRLTESPFMGVAYHELAQNVRKFPVGNYNIFYRPIEHGIEVVRVLHGRRQTQSKLFEENQ